MTVKDITPTIIEGIHSKKGTDVKIVDLGGIDTAPANSFVICQARNPIQVAAVADAVVDAVLEEAGRKPISSDGYRNREWIIVDYGEVIVHIFLPETRARYALEELYTDAPVIFVQDEDDPNISTDLIID